LKIFDALIAALCGNGYMKAGNLIKRSAHHVVLSPELTEAAGNIRRLVSEKPFDPPARKQIAPDARTRQMLSLLIDEKEIIDLGPDLVLSKKAFTEMKTAVTDFIAKNGPATVSELRQMLQTSRRTVVPFLERLDREHITRRVGDQRTLVEKL
jgi:selenocysteine-specific elongation factor